LKASSISQGIRYVGLDVTKATFAVAVGEFDRSVVEYGTIPKCCQRSFPSATGD
jgi:hypothetical protein